MREVPTPEALANAPCHAASSDQRPGQSFAPQPGFRVLAPLDGDIDRNNGEETTNKRAQ